MCGIAGAIHLAAAPIPDLAKRLTVMQYLLRHRGPDGARQWLHSYEYVGFAHRRLSIIDLSTGQQPMRDGGGNWVTYNGEIYNYLELRRELGRGERIALITYAAPSPLPCGTRPPRRSSAPATVLASNPCTTRWSIRSYTLLPR
jgi:asparagine synthetase B (glutamine-hydrolysing)